MTMHERETQVTGVVLAGGQSRRFGRDKALAAFEETTMMGHAIALLRAASKEVFIVTHPDRDYLGLDAKIIHDIYPDHGPLGGIYTACRYATTPSLLVLSCDMPLLSPRSVFHLLYSFDPKKPVTIYRHQGSLQPFPGIYDITIQPQLQKLIKQRRLSMQGFFSELTDIKIVPLKREELEFTNVNTQHQLMSLQRRNRRKQKDNDNETNTPNPPGAL